MRGDRDFPFGIDKGNTPPGSNPGEPFAESPCQSEFGLCQQGAICGQVAPELADAVRSVAVFEAVDLFKLKRNNFLALGIDMRSLRALRMLRLFRLFKLVRYNNAIERFARAFAIAREEIVVFAVVTVILLFFSGIGIYYFEHEAQPDVFSSIFHSLWWAMVTLTTVGYGDMVPITAGGRIFTFFMLLIGLGIVAVPAGLLAAALNKVRRDDDDEADE